MKRCLNFESHPNNYNFSKKTLFDLIGFSERNTLIINSRIIFAFGFLATSIKEHFWNLLNNYLEYILDFIKSRAYVECRLGQGQMYESKRRGNKSNKRISVSRDSGDYLLLKNEWNIKRKELVNYFLKENEAPRRKKHKKKKENVKRLSIDPQEFKKTRFFLRRKKSVKRYLKEKIIQNGYVHCGFSIRGNQIDKRMKNNSLLNSLQSYAYPLQNHQDSRKETNKSRKSIEIKSGFLLQARKPIQIYTPQVNKKLLLTTSFQTEKTQSPPNLRANNFFYVRSKNPKSIKEAPQRIKTCEPKVEDESEKLLQNLVKITDKFRDNTPPFRPKSNFKDRKSIQVNVNGEKPSALRISTCSDVKSNYKKLKSRIFTSISKKKTKKSQFRESSGTFLDINREVKINYTSMTKLKRNKFKFPFRKFQNTFVLKRGRSPALA